MKPLSFFAVAVALLGVSAAPSLAEEVVIIGSPAEDFLGVVLIDGERCSRYDSNCIWNPYSDYGSDYSEQSIFNDYSQYGSEYGVNSICNLNIDYEETVSLYLIKDGSLFFFDIIGPDSETIIGRDLYMIACAR
jgi:hypothetical protein